MSLPQCSCNCAKNTVVAQPVPSKNFPMISMRCVRQQMQCLRHTGKAYVKLTTFDSLPLMTFSILWGCRAWMQTWIEQNLLKPTKEMSHRQVVVSAGISMLPTGVELWLRQHLVKFLWGQGQCRLVGRNLSSQGQRPGRKACRFYESLAIHHWNFSTCSYAPVIWCIWPSYGLTFQNRGPTMHHASNVVMRFGLLSWSS